MTLFDWLKELTGKKRDWDSFSDKERESFNPYMINRFLSMHEPFIELVNYVQTIPYTEKQKYYTVYCQLLPKKNVWLKYIKSKIKSNPKEIKEYISRYYQCSLDEANEYIILLGKEGVNNIFTKMGIEDKEKKSLTKKIV